MSITGSISDASRQLLDKVANDPKNTSRLKSQSLDKNAFFKLLLEQLKNQDPMSPMDNSAMISQMAQFSTMEQLGNMVQSQSDMYKATQLTNDYLKTIAENSSAGESNKEVLAELKKMNQLLAEYLPAAQDGSKVNQLLEALLSGAQQQSEDEDKNGASSDESGVQENNGA